MTPHPAASPIALRSRASLALALCCAALIAEPIQAQAVATQNVGAQTILAQNIAAEPTVSFSSSVGPAQDAAQPKALHIVILEGDEAINNIRDRTAREPIVQVEDENHKPVAGALVLFTLHGGTGATGSASSLGSLSVTTGADGHAVAHGLQINQVTGKVTIDVHATSGNLSADTTIHQTNVTSTTQDGSNANQTVKSTTRKGIRSSSLTHNLLIVAGAIGVAAAVIVVGTRASGTTITPGIGAVGH